MVSSASHPTAPLALRVVSVVVISLCLTAAGVSFWMVVDTHLSASPAAYAWAFGGSAQAICQYLSVYRFRRVPAIMAAILPVLAGAIYLVAQYRLLGGAFRRPMVGVFLLMTQMGPALVFFALAVLMFVWFRRLGSGAHTTDDRSEGGPTVVIRVRDKAVATTGVFIVSAILLFASFLLMPKGSGVPATFGPIIQPLAWFCALTATGIGIVTAFLSSRISSLGSEVAFRTAIVVLCVDCSQFLFAVLGPDI